MPAWLPWLLLAAIPVLAVVIRLLAGDDEPRNEIHHEQPAPDDEGPDRDQGPALLRAAA